MMKKHTAQVVRALKTSKKCYEHYRKRFIISCSAFWLDTGAFPSRRTLSAGTASASSSLRSFGVFGSCFSRRSRRLPLQSTSQLYIEQKKTHVVLPMISNQTCHIWTVPQGLHPTDHESPDFSKNQLLRRWARQS